MRESAEFQPEFSLLLEAARAVASGGDQVDSSVDTNAVDWQTAHRLARRHGLLSHLHRYLEALPDTDVPADVYEAFRDEVQLNHHENLRYAGEMHRLTAAFEDSGVRALPFKGPVVSVLAYGGLGLRTFGDLDFLVPAADVPEAAAVLQSRGYVCETTMGPFTYDDIGSNHRADYFPFPGELSFVEENSDDNVELRFARGALYGDGHLDVETLWENRERAVVAEREVSVLSPTDRLVMLTNHGSKHMWYRLEWLAGLAGTSRRTEGNWQRARERSEALGMLSELFLGVHLLAEFFDVDVPPGLEREAKTHERVANVGSTIIDRYANDPMDVPSEARLRRDRGVLHGDRLRRHLRYATQPTVADYRLVTLPDPLWPLYRVIRPVRGGLKVLLP